MTSVFTNGNTEELTGYAIQPNPKGEIKTIGTAPEFVEFLNVEAGKTASDSRTRNETLVDWYHSLIGGGGLRRSGDATSGRGHDLPLDDYAKLLKSDAYGEGVTNAAQEVVQGPFGPLASFAVGFFHGFQKPVDKKTYDADPFLIDLQEQKINFFKELDQQFPKSGITPELLEKLAYKLRGANLESLEKGLLEKMTKYTDAVMKKNYDVINESLAGLYSELEKYKGTGASTEVKELGDEVKGLYKMFEEFKDTFSVDKIYIEKEPSQSEEKPMSGSKTKSEKSTHDRKASTVREEYGTKINYGVGAPEGIIPEGYMSAKMYSETLNTILVLTSNMADIISQLSKESGKSADYKGKLAVIEGVKDVVPMLNKCAEFYRTAMDQNIELYGEKKDNSKFEPDRWGDGMYM